MHRRAARIGLVLSLSCGLLGHASAPQRSEGALKQILGAWQLESRTVRKANGDSLLDPVLGRQPTGRLFYDASGRMMLQMMRQERAQAISTLSNAQDAKNPKIVRATPSR